ncbi:hypothetical protein [Halosimplex pelagicum]|uniref:Uncharacterized protein n=1 Tax=Halosimplex pelagicum TaxID=869886 RepID=A0A7D5TEI8_9EURY|nr:hypothetical protein [Halosimplex pelagicum]QLH84773.1 hypothetical protein HZS54_25380 [Halosimplex pelagicum]
MNASEGVFRTLLAVGLALLVLTAGLFVLQEPGTGGYAVTVISLVAQAVMVLVGAAGLYFEWDPLAPLFDEE